MTDESGAAARVCVTNRLARVAIAAVEGKADEGRALCDFR
jgi:hypothetical protein